MFSKNYTAYKMSTFPYSFEVDRRYSDFAWLHSQFLRDYPGYYVRYEL